MDDVSIVKQKTDIVSVIGEHVNLKKAGRNYKGLCPFHNEKTPSFMVSPELQIFKCFGCGESGDVFSFLQKYEGMEFYEALVSLAKRSGVALRGSFTNQKSDKAYLLELNALVAKFYHYILTKHPFGKYALDYLIKERRLKPATISEFNLGYSPQQPSLFHNFFFSKKKISPSDLEKAGIVYIKDGFAIDRFRGRVVFPLADSRGNICGFAGRITPRDSNKELAKYINTPETAVYRKSELLYGIHLAKRHIKMQKSAVVVEGELDMISCYQVGVKNVVAIKGSALTSDQAHMLSRLCSKIILAFDSDFAGDSAAKRGIKVLNEYGFEVSVAEFGKYKDPDEAARCDKQSLFKGIDNAVPVWDFIISSIFKKHAKDGNFSKSRISREVVAVLCEIDDLIIRSFYINFVAGKLGVSQEVVEAQVQNYIRSRRKILDVAQFDVKTTIAESANDNQKQKDVVELWQERLFSLTISYDLKQLINLYEDGVFTNVVLKKIIDHYKNYNDLNISYAKLVEILPPELSEKAKNLALLDIPEDQEDIQKEIRELTIRIKRHNLNLEKEMILSKIRKIEVDGNDKNEDELINLQKKFNQIVHKIASLALDR
ncbi:MAG: DNA primase [Patescibacteria group bacterium]|nr:DNA primase [Patescibacteria group bacterium]